MVGRVEQHRRRSVVMPDLVGISHAVPAAGLPVHQEEVDRRTRYAAPLPGT